MCRMARKGHLSEDDDDDYIKSIQNMSRFTFYNELS